MPDMYWDPVYASLDAEAVRGRNEKLLKKIQLYSQAPGALLRKRLVLAYLISLLIILFLFSIPMTSDGRFLEILLQITECIMD